jgi:phospholipase D1/2
MSVAAIRLLPVAPFTIVSLAAGALRVPMKDYIIGSALGLLPGIIAITLLSGQLQRAVTGAGSRWLVLIVITMFISLIVAKTARHHVTGRTP